MRQRPYPARSAPAQPLDQSEGQGPANRPSARPHQGNRRDRFSRLRAINTDQQCIGRCVKSNPHAKAQRQHPHQRHDCRLRQCQQGQGKGQHKRRRHQHLAPASTVDPFARHHAGTGSYKKSPRKGCEQLVRSGACRCGDRLSHDPQQIIAGSERDDHARSQRQDQRKRVFRFIHGPAMPAIVSPALAIYRSVHVPKPHRLDIANLADRAAGLRGHGAYRQCHRRRCRTACDPQRH